MHASRIFRGRHNIRCLLSCAMLFGAACAAEQGQDDSPALTGAGTFAAAGSSAGASAQTSGTLAEQPTAGLGGNTSGSGAGESASDGGGLDSLDASSTGSDAGGEIVPSDPGYLHTEGSKIVDSDGNVVRLTGINWFGMETSNYSPHGLWSRSLGSMLDQVKSLGYNMLRLPFCSQFLDAGSMPNGIDYAMNPELMGLSGLALLDAIVDAAKTRGLRVVLDRHRPDSGGQSNLWYTAAYSEERWIDDWEMLAEHYKDNTTVIGFDLHNEPHGEATWGDDNMATDFRLAAERAGNAVLAKNPNLLIIVEGVEKVGDKSGWWGGNLRGAKDHPVRLSIAQRLVYSAHDYPASVFNQPWFSDAAYPSNLPQVWRDAWGYLVEDDIAPVWLGEFGTKHETDVDKKWLQALADYLGDHEISFAYWCLNPNSGDTGGILADDWSTVKTDKQAVLDPLLAPLIP